MGLLSTVGSMLGGDTIKDVGSIIDNLHTSGEEKLAAKQALQEVLIKATTPKHNESILNNTDLLTSSPQLIFSEL